MGLLLLTVGMLTLVLGAEALVRGATRLARTLGVPPLLLGLTVVSIGTSAPELAVGLAAVERDAGALAVGNIAGTNLVNILLILGLSAWIRALPLRLQSLRLDLPAMILATVAMSWLAHDGRFSRADGLLLLAGSAVYTVLLVRVSGRESALVRREFRDMYPPETATAATPAMRSRGPRWAADALLLLGGIALAVLGAGWLVSGAVALAHVAGVDEAIIGLSVVALGTSLPELATTLVATRRDERDVAVGNLIGSSIYNILLILGLTCLAAPDGLPAPAAVSRFDLPLLVAVALLCVPVFASGRRVSRGEGALLVAIYAAYVAWLYLAR